MKVSLLIAVVALGSAACGSAVDDTPVEGIITEVSGGLGSVVSFVVMDDRGEMHEFDPKPGLLFYGGPLDHLRDHIVTSQRVKVTFERSTYGVLTATLIEHADSDATHETPTEDQSGHDMSEMGDDATSDDA